MVKFDFAMMIIACLFQILPSLGINNIILKRGALNRPEKYRKEYIFYIGVIVLPFEDWTFLKVRLSNSYSTILS